MHESSCTHSDDLGNRGSTELPDWYTNLALVEQVRGESRYIWRLVGATIPVSKIVPLQQLFCQRQTAPETSGAVQLFTTIS